MFCLTTTCNFRSCKFWQPNHEDGPSKSHSIKDSPVLVDHDTVSEGAYSSEDCREVQARELLSVW